MQLHFPGNKADRAVMAFIGIFFISMLIVCFTARGTGDEGDSVFHYLYARYAFKHPALFFDQWAKPVYVLMASFFAQLGFWGVKLMNLLFACTSMWVTYKTAQQLKINNAWMTPVILAFIPMNIVLTLSGLTEPLFALVLIAGIYLLIAERKFTALILLSFLPFVRSEGLVILLVLIVYLFIIRDYELVPLLGVGHVVYMIAGYFVHKDFLWVFNKISYATLESTYGSGKWLHFVLKLPETIGLAGACFAVVGVFAGLILLIKWLRKENNPEEKKQLFLVYGIFLAFFISHTIFWALGIFKSMGLLRVMVGIMPLFAIIIVKGMQYALSPFKNSRWYPYSQYLMLSIIVVYAFSKHDYALHWNKSLVLKADQKAQVEMAQYVRTNYPDYRKYEFYYEATFVCLVLNQDYFNDKEHKRLQTVFEKNNFADKSFIVWDDWFAVQEAGITLQKIEQDGRFEKIKVFQRQDYWGVTRTTILFRKK